MTENRQRAGFFGQFGGRYVAEVLRAALDELDAAFSEAIVDESFLAEVARLGQQYIGRPTPLLHAENISARLGGAQIYIKLEGSIMRSARHCSPAGWARNG